MNNLYVGDVAAMALTQRGCLYRLLGDKESAVADLEVAAHLGSSFASRVLVQMNPYAALCNDMLTSMMTKCATGDQLYC